VFQDERLTTVARLVYWFSAVILVSAAVLLLITIVASPADARNIALVSLGCGVLVAAAMLFVRSGHPVGAARIVVTGIWFLSTAFVVASGGLESPAVIGPLFSIALAGILLGLRECITFAVLVGGTAFGMAWAESTGLIAAAEVTNHWITAGLFSVYGGAIAALQILTVKSLRKAIDGARNASDGLALARKVYDTTSEGIVVTTPDGSIIDVNDAYLRIHGYERADVIGQNTRMMRSGKHEPDYYRDMWGSLLSEGRWQGEVWNRRADGSLLPTWLSLSAVSDDKGITTDYVGVVSDITAIKRGEEDLQWLATHDPLTSLPNRALLEDRLTTILARSRRQKTKAAVFYFDLDHFKNVNDTLGHLAGDRLLVEIGKRCLSVVRESDTFGRSGGDEFAVIVSDFSDVEYLSLLAKRLLSVVSKPVVLGGQETYVTASIGIAVYPEDGADATELNQHADVAMYRAKTLGRNRYELFSEGMQAELQQRVEVEMGLREAVKDDRLFVVYQPQVDLTTGLIVGVEALVRWRDTDGSVIMPDEFIPVAETSGLILDVGAAVLRRACADMRTLHDEGHPLTMAMNVSARELMDQDVATIVVAAINAAGLNPSAFEVEITESSIVTRTEIVAAKVRSLQDNDVAVSIDDFGTGYASMAYVMDFHPSKLKIDRSFVSAVPLDPSACAIVSATIALAKGIGAKVLAEGPETEEHVRYLRESGCDFAQGYYFSEPIPLEELRELLDRGPCPLPD